MRNMAFRILGRAIFTVVFMGCIFSSATSSNVTAGEKLKVKIKRIKIQTSSGDPIDVIHGYPVTEGRHPAIIYNHGSSVRKFGYRDSVNRGYDVKDFVRALAKAGYVAVAPLRKHKRLPSRKGPPGDVVFKMPAEEWTDAVEEGLGAISASIGFLKKQPNVADDRIGIIGFSEGGLITIFSAFEHNDLRAVVLIAPALGRSPIYRYSTAIPRIDEIHSPVFLLLGRSDIPGIIDRCTKRFIPSMKRAGKEIETRIDYPGDHGWFHKVRAQYWNDIVRFLDRKMK